MEWIEYETADGVPYYYHLVTKATTWEKPATFHRAAALGVAFRSTVTAGNSAAVLDTSGVSDAVRSESASVADVSVVMSQASHGEDTPGGLEDDEIEVEVLKDAVAHTSTSTPRHTKAVAWAMGQAATVAKPIAHTPAHNASSSLQPEAADVQAKAVEARAARAPARTAPTQPATTSARSTSAAPARTPARTSPTAQPATTPARSTSTAPASPSATTQPATPAAATTPASPPTRTTATATATARTKPTPAGGRPVLGPQAARAWASLTTTVAGAGAEAGAGSAAPVAPRPTTSGRRGIAGARLTSIMVSIMPYLPVQDVLDSTLVCSAWAAVRRKLTFWSQLYFQLPCASAEHLKAMRISAVSPRWPQPWRRVVLRTLKAMAKWSRTAGTKQTTFSVSVSVRFKPLDEAKLAAEEEKKAALQKQLAALRKRQAKAAKEATRKQLGGGRCPWDRSGDRFGDEAKAARKLDSEIKSCEGELEAAQHRTELVHKEKWFRNVVEVGVNGGAVSKRFTEFDYVLHDKSGQAHVHRRVGRRVVEACSMGFDATLFVYGQTGSGKTYTIFGPAGAFDDVARRQVGACKRLGLLSRIVKDLLKIRSEPNVRMNLSCSAYEVYQDQVFDLLNPGGPRGTLVETRDGFAVAGSRVQRIRRTRDLFPIASRIEASRVAGTTKMNARSSRSHCIIVLRLVQTNTATAQTLRSKLLLVDLAGSERIKKSGSKGLRRSEAIQINGSLTSLGRTIKALSEGERHVPYRDCTLTKLLRQSLGGNSRTALIVTCAQEPEHLEETVASMRFGQRTATVRNEAKREATNRAIMIRDARARLAEAQQTLRQLAAQGQAGGWGTDRFNNPVGTATRHRYTHTKRRLATLKQTEVEVNRRIAGAIAAAGGSREGSQVRALVAEHRQVRQSMAAAAAALQEMRRAGVYREASALYQQTAGQVADLHAELARLQDE